MSNETNTPEVSEVEASSNGAEESSTSFRAFTGRILGKIFTQRELEESDAPQEPEVEDDELQRLIDESLTEVTAQKIVSGRVVAVGEKDVHVDIGFKSDGIVPKNEFTDVPSVGDEVELYLERKENYHGQLVVSKTKAFEVRRWEAIESAFEHGTVLEGTISHRIKGGMIVDLIDGLEAFLPGSQIDVRPVRDFDAYVGRRMEFKIVKINASNENVVVSHKALIEKELAVQRESILSSMEVGQVLKGVAKNITEFGVFVDLGGVDGLLHITDLTWGRVSHPTEVVQIEDDLNVVVLDYDRERQRISLGLKQLTPHPWENIEERYKPAQAVEGKVVSITDYGAFLELEKGIEGLVHISEMSWTDHIRHPSQKVSLGQIVKAEVLSIDHSTKKISLGMKKFESNPWEGVVERYPPGTILKGPVRNITHFGVFVEIEPGVDGLVHISDLSWTKTLEHPGELVRKRQMLSVVILDVDTKRRRIALGHKQIETNPWNNLQTVYEVGSDHEAKVINVDTKGLTVELPLEVEAFVPSTELRVAAHQIFSTYREGDMLKLRVMRLDIAQKEIAMSETAKERQQQSRIRKEEEKAKRRERMEQERAVRRHAKKERDTRGPTTLGELSGLQALRDRMAAEEEAEAKAQEQPSDAAAPAD